MNDEIHTFNLCSLMFKPQRTCSGMHTNTKHCTIWRRAVTYEAPTQDEERAHLQVGRSAEYEGPAQDEKHYFSHA